MFFNKKAFSLIELTIVLIIIVILWTVWFISYSGYLIWARDTARITDLNTISNSLIIQTTKWKLPVPDDYIEVSLSGSLMSYQWHAWKSVFNVIGLARWWKDPKDDTFYSYYITKNKRYFQLMWFLENGSNLQINNITHLTTTYTNEDYSHKFPVVLGNQLWILTWLWDNLNVPIQEIDEIKDIWGLDIWTTSTEFKSYISNAKVIVWDKDELISLLPNSSCERILESWASVWNWMYKITTNWSSSQVYCDMWSITLNKINDELCWSSHNTYSWVKPSSHNLCNSWSSSNLLSNSLSWTWTCSWIDWKSSSNCNANKNIKWECWTSIEKSFLLKPINNLCAFWNLSNSPLLINDKWNWKCEWIGDWDDDDCYANYEL